jgi:hypothetical protein
MSLLPSGFEDRFATLKVAVSGDGHLLKVMIIFFGTGQKVEKYPDTNETVVTFQKKAWIDGTGQKEFLKRVLKPYLHGIRARLGLNDKAEVLLTNENVKPHHDWEARRFGHEQLCMLNLNTPPNLTHCIQLIDDCVGDRFRSDVLIIINDAIDENNQGHWTPMMKRQLIQRAVLETVQNWRTSESRIKLMRGAAARTGLAMEVSGRIPADRTADGADPSSLPWSLNRDLKPVRFPADYPLSLVNPKHRNANDFEIFLPFLPRGAVAFIPGADSLPNPENGELDEDSDEID